MSRQSILILGTTENVSIDIWRSLKSFDLDMILAYPFQRKWVENSKVFDYTLPLPAPNSNFQNWLQIIEKIGIDYLDKKSQRMLILPSDDIDLKFLSVHEMHLSKYFIILGSTKNQKLSNLVDKSYINKKLKSILKPFTISYTGDLKILEKITFKPILVKPASKGKSNTFSKLYGKFRLFRDTKSLEKFLNKIKLKYGNLIIQSYIPKKPLNEYSWIGYRDNNKRCEGFTVCKKRQIPIGAGTTFAEISKDKDLEMLSKKIIEDLKFYGICEIEYLYDYNDETFYFLEFNARPCRWFYLAIGSGLNLFLPFLNELGINGLQKQEQSHHQRKWMDLRIDFYYHVLKQNDINGILIIRFMKWFFSIRGSNLTFINRFSFKIVLIEIKRFIKMLFVFFVRRRQLNLAGEIRKEDLQIMDL